jgi:hypothetical protein
MGKCRQSMKAKGWEVSAPESELSIQLNAYRSMAQASSKPPSPSDVTKVP